VLREIDAQRREMKRLLTGDMAPETAEATIAGLQHIKDILAQDARPNRRSAARRATGAAGNANQSQPLAAAPEAP
jgi:hypothetical protein